MGLTSARPSEGGSATQWLSAATVTIILMNLTGMLQAISDQLLPSVLHEVAESFDVTPTELGGVQAVRIFVSAFASLIAAYLVSMKVNRARIVGMGTLLSGITAAGVALSFRYGYMMVWRAIDGLAPALVVPAVQSIIADSYTETERGKAFGLFSICWSLGRVVGSLFGTMIASGKVGGFEGWRAAFCIMSFGAVCLGMLVITLASDPSQPSGKRQQQEYERLASSKGSISLNTKQIEDTNADTSAWGCVKKLGGEVRDVWHVKTFRAIVLQGVVGSYPWQAMAFLTMWLELVGFSHEQSALLIAAFSLGNSLGSYIGGCLGDLAARKLPNTGRIICSQISTGCVIPTFAIILHGLPRSVSAFPFYCAAFFIGGACITWNSAATNSPIFSEIVPARLRTTIYATDRMLETILSSFGPYGVGLVAEHVYGYDLHRQTNGADPADAAALADALFMNIALPAAMSGIFYTWLYWTYPKDRDDAKAAARLAAGEGAPSTEFAEKASLLAQDEEMALLATTPKLASAQGTVPRSRRQSTVQPLTIQS
ncbi:major facilitator superfamily protein [Klebsormidium nitens]|uniref:Major facilitator superfamily protein n=1 Tax=Klebsormidium nitens TaxID=105231 RepID=A0A1Y1HZ47_KLENI|nr:major facilitator superfamily protein [Klebsormidium nitens]|eukprot:GAQ83463.1 major facilitator superfamily protein [Klebsormidium nitens]